MKWETRRRMKPAEPSPTYPQHDNGLPGFLPWENTNRGFFPLRCLSMRQCDSAVNVLNEIYADKTLNWLKEHWESVVCEIKEGGH